MGRWGALTNFADVTQQFLPAQLSKVGFQIWDR